MDSIKYVYYNSDLWRYIESYLLCLNCNKNKISKWGDNCNECIMIENERLEKIKKEREFEEYYMSMLL